MATIADFVVHGNPKPQGSKNAFTPKGAKFPVVVESAGEALKHWRYAVAQKAAEVMGDKLPHNGAVSVELTFRMSRPKSHYGTGRNAGTLKESSPEHHVVKPDIDKLTRAVFDSLSKRVYGDDSQVCEMSVKKKYPPPSVHVVVKKREQNGSR